MQDFYQTPAEEKQLQSFHADSRLKQWLPRQCEAKRCSCLVLMLRDVANAAIQRCEDCLKVLASKGDLDARVKAAESLTSLARGERMARAPRSARATIAAHHVQPCPTMSHEFPGDTKSLSQY